MGKPTGFKEIPREMPRRRPVRLRVLDWREIYLEMEEPRLRDQAARCMDCGVPFCMNGCPLGNIIPEWNDLVYKGRWRDAIDMLLKTNNFPEFTGRVCPAPCEEACVLNINARPVTIKLVEQNIIERAFREGWIRPEPPPVRTGKKVAVVGSGPAGLACAAQLNSAGHLVTVFERADRVGGLLTYGIPNFKLEKWVVQRRIGIMQEEGVTFIVNADVGANPTSHDLLRDFDAVVLCGGATRARDLNVPGRELRGIHRAMEYLTVQNRLDLGDSLGADEIITAAGKNVIILGGGDTGADCLGTALRQGCRSVCQFELLPAPPPQRTDDMPWPQWPMILRTSSAHEEATVLQEGIDAGWPAKIRDWAINTKAFSGEGGEVRRIHCVRVEWSRGEGGRMVMREIPGTGFEMPCDLCLLAMGFVSPEHQGPIEQLGLATDARGNVTVNEDYMTSVPGVFCAGDMRRGQSLVVWAISEGRQAARGVDRFLMGRSDLPYLKLF